MMENYLSEDLISSVELDKAIEQAVLILETALKTNGYNFRYSHSVNNFYQLSDNVEWTTGFYTGQLWLSYELTGNKIFTDAALRQVDSFFERIEKKIDVNHHDMGFLYSPSCVAAYKIMGSEVGKKAALLASNNLASRFQEKGRFIQAWGDLGDKDNYRLIIDCLLNLPLLYWAFEIDGNAKYKEIADAHLETAMNLVVREDNSTYHTYFMDTETGKPLKGVTFQGYKDTSSWARGQAWGIYGAALAYKYKKKPEYLDIFRRTSSFFLSNIPLDVIPYWDFDFSYPSSEPKDSSALAIAVCGIQEMTKYLDGDEKEFYDEVSSRLLGALWRKSAVKNLKESDGLLLHGTYARKSPYNPCKNRGVDECNLWGDYFYLEALRRKKNDWEPYW